MRSASFGALCAVGLIIGACTGGTTPGGTENAELLAAPRSGEGIQLKMVSTLAPGVETERCMFYQVPPEGMAIHRQEIRFTPGSHHVLVYMTPYAEIPTKNLQGQPVDTSGVFECGQGGPTANWSVDGVVAAGQDGDGEPMIGGLPADTAVVVPGGAVVMMNTHYLNASPRPLDTEARINFFVMPKEQVKREAGLLFFYNIFIHVPPNSRASARLSCPIRKDITLVNGASHMHKRGVDYTAHLTDGQGQPLSELYRTTNWEDVVPARFQPPRELKAGQRIDYRCTYENKENRTVIQGLSTSDEMCMFVGLYYPRDIQTEFCALDEKAEAPYVGGDWIGTGTADGTTTADCLTRAMSQGESEAGAATAEEALYSCVVGSCPALSAPTSESVRCLFGSGEKCEQSCKEGGDACRSCLRAMCEAPLGDLKAATCN
jgi:hypothetical protein